MLTDEKFFESAKKFFLLKDVNGKYYSLDEYKKLIEPTQTDKEGTLIYLYTNDTAAQYAYIKSAEEKGYSVLVMNGELDDHFMSMLESKDQKLRFVRVDSDIPERLIEKDNNSTSNLSADQTALLQGLFSARLPKNDHTQFIVAVESMGENEAPATLVQNEFTRRMKKMAEQQPGMAFMGQMPDTYQLVVNANQPAVHKLLERATATLQNDLNPIISEITTLNESISKIRADKDISDDNRKKVEEDEKKVSDLRKQQEDIVGKYAAEQNVISQIIDLALLQTGLLKGKELSDFISRSISLL